VPKQPCSDKRLSNDFYEPINYVKMCNQAPQYWRRTGHVLKQHEVRTKVGF